MPPAVLLTRQAGRSDHAVPRAWLRLAFGLHHPRLDALGVIRVSRRDRERLQETRSVRRLVQTIRRSLAEFLALPSAVIGCFLALAALTSYLDAAGIDWLASTRAFLRRYVFGDASATSELLT